MEKSVFGDIQPGPPVEVFAVNKNYLDDTNAVKVNLSIGAYRTEEEKPWVLPVVRKVEQLIAADEKLNHEYLPVLGMEAFANSAAKILYGSESRVVVDNMVIPVQCLSGTGALRVGAEFLHHCLGYNTFYISDPTWENHTLLFSRAGFTDCRRYRYWNANERKFDLHGMLEDLKDAPPKSVVVLHACAHNPTGIDPKKEDWDSIATVMKEKGLFPFFDCAYQGFASGDLDNDAFAVRHFVKRGFELLCAQSFAKNFGLYNERIGNLTLIVNDVKVIPAVKSQLTLIARAMYSNPPVHGARIVTMILNNSTLFDEWKQCIKTMSSRIRSMRVALRDRLVTLQTPGTWDHITEQIGMFSYTGLNPVQVDHLTKEHHIYLLRSGRINMCGLNMKNIDHVANAIHEAVIKFQNSKY